MTSFPVDSLPPELLPLVFSLALPEDAFNVYSRKYSPLNVSQVCSSWRNLALATPSLWSHLTYPIGRVTFTHYEDVWRLWLERSKHHSLRFTIAHSPPWTSLKRSLVRIMIDNFDRWRDIHLELRHNVATIIIPHFPRTLKRLDSVGFSIMYRTPSMTTDWMKDLVSRSDWSYTNEHHSVSAVAFRAMSGGQYEELSGGTSSSNYTGGILDGAHLSLSVGQIHRENPNLFPSNLRHLYVFRYDDDYQRTRFSMADLICRSEASLEALILCRVNISTNDLRSVLRHSTRLKELRLSCCSSLDVNGIFDFLEIHPDTLEVICPALRVFEICASHLKKAEDVQPFMGMTVSRWEYAKSKESNLSLIEQLNGLDTYLTCGQRQDLQRCILEGLHYQHRNSIGLQCFDTP